MLSHFTNQDMYPLSQTQLGIFIESMRHQGQISYNIPFLFELDAEIDLFQLAKAFEAVVEAHPYIKCKLMMDSEGRVWQKSDCGEPFALTVEEIDDISQVKEGLVRPFDLLKDSLFRIRLFRSPSSNYLFMDFHHIIYDGSSYGILVNELNKAYEGMPLEKEEWSAFDISREESEARQTEEYEEAKAWYEKNFGGLNVDSQLLPDRNDEVASFGKVKRYLRLPVDAVESFCQQHKLSKSSFFTAAFGYLMAVYRNDSEFLLTTIYHGRKDKRSAKTFGMFVKTFPVYQQFQDTATVLSLIRSTQEQISESKKHDLFSFVEISEQLGINSQLLFVYQGTVLADGSLCGKPLIRQELIESATGEQLAVQVYKEPDGFSVMADYHANVYSKQLIEQLLDSYAEVLDGFLRNQYLAEISIVSSEQIRLLDRFNQTQVEFDASRSIVSLFREQAARHPDHRAVVYKDKAYTYREVDEITERIGNAVKKLGLGREQVVSILIPRNEYMTLASLGVLKAGCAYQPLDPSYPSERLHFMMKDADARLLITDESLRTLVSDYDGPVLFTKEIPDLPFEDIRLEDPNPDDLLILLYTSGSTGVPKGCMIEHRNLVAFCHWYRRFYELTPDSHVSAYASYGFDANMMDMYPALTTGATVYIIEEEIRLDLQALNEYYERNAITHGFMTTQVGQQFVLNVENHSLNCFSIGGEKLMPLNPPANYRFYNVYGPTECTVLTTSYHVTRYEDNIPIGMPLDNFKLYIVDKAGRRLPVGAAGELWISGFQVSRGYLNRPDLTEKVYIPNPFSRDEGYERIYRSGDIVRYRPDGNIEFVGRKDGQVKIRGFRIELKEVEAIIREYPDIKDVTVQAFDDTDGGKYIAAYIVADKPVDIQSLNAFILDNKPPYMVPAVTMQIDKIPLTQNQKVDKKALPVPEKRVSVPEEGKDSHPLNMLEEELHQLIAEVVRTSDFGVTTNLGYIGLTSISAIKLATVLYKKYEMNVEPKSLIKQGSILMIENRILQNLLTPSSTSSEGKEKAITRAESYPLSYSQTGVYYECLKKPTETVYNIPLKLVFPTAVSADKLAVSVAEVVSAHPYLNTHFEMRGEDVVQVCPAAGEEAVVSRLELTEDELLQYQKEFVKPFNLAKSPLYRLSVVQTEKRVYLLADFHHLIIDGSSCDLFIEQLIQRLEGRELEPETYSYFDYVAEEKEAKDKDGYVASKRFFDQLLRTCEGASEIPADLNNPNENGLLAESVYPVNHLPSDSFCKVNGITPAHLFLAGTFYAISRYVNNKQVCISTISSGRSNMKIANTLGMFVNTLPLSSEVKGQTVVEFIRETGEMLDETIRHENYPFAQIAADYNFKPEIMYAYQVGVLNEYKVNNQPVGMESLELKVPKFKLSIHIEEREGKVCVVLQYNDALYSRSLMDGLAESIGTAVDHFITDPSGKIDSVSLLSERQWALISSFHESGRAEVPIRLFHQGIEKQAELHPDRIALVAVDKTFTYQEMNTEMNRVAHGLIRLGIHPGDRVALLLPRVSGLIIAMFGVMKSGAAYIPCDPEYPAERVKHILEDSNAAYIITTRSRMADFPSGQAIDIAELLKETRTGNPDVEIRPTDLAYLIYTSGSTGKPKGVMLNHGGICNYLYDHPLNQHVHALATEARCMLSVTTISFDMSLKEIGTSLFNGLTLVLASEDQANNPILLAELFDQTHADAFNATPSRMLQYMELPAFCEALSRCKIIMSGGEKYSEKLLRRLHEIGNARIFNTYGPTEITVSSNCKELTQVDTISIGRPLLNYKEFIVDVDGNELPVGVVGELYIGGVGVAQGYNQLEQMTQERFIDYQGCRVYKSGDYAKWTEDGDVAVLGRTDNQVKLRGLRIELGEIEACLTHVIGIKNAIVMIRSIKEKEHICAYFTADRPMEIEALKDELKKKLAAYMIPTAYMQMEKMPLTPNGKTDLKALPEPQLAIGGAREEAANEIERQFCDIFGKILELETVGATDNFFDLGGTSLVVTRIIIEASNLGYTISYGDVFSHPTPRALTLLVRQENIPDSDSSKEIAEYDYSLFKELLRANNLDNFKKGEFQPLGNVLLTGATGFLGIHILKELLNSEVGNIYCLLRDRQNVSAEIRLKSMLFYYFDHSYEELFGKRIIVVQGDVTQPEVFDQLAGEPIQTVINCAANVKHFSKGTDIEDVNIGGAKNIITYCLKTKSRMIHVSTMSVNGLSVNGYPKQGTAMTEQMLYFGQFIDNKYVRSKFMAERMILENIRENGLNAKIMRVGNLSARNTDGEFQINFNTNSFMGRLRIFLLLGVCTYEQLDNMVEFSPIDEVAKTILLLSTTPKECCIFHPYNPHSQFLGDILREMGHLRFAIKAVESDDFMRALEQAKADPDKAKILSSMIAYENMAHGLQAVPNVKYNKYTMQVLYRLGYQWPVTSWDYISRFLRALQGLGFFNDSEY